MSKRQVVSLIHNYVRLTFFEKKLENDDFTFGQKKTKRCKEFIKLGNYKMKHLRWKLFNFSL